MMRWSGRSVDRRRAINPDSVKTAMMRVFISSAANAAASHRARLTRPLCLPTSLLMMDRFSLRVSAVSMMRAIVATAATGYSPVAVSPDNIRQSDPSQTALATSVASARVGRGLETIDCNICVAVMTSLPASFACSMICF